MAICTWDAKFTWVLSLTEENTLHSQKNAAASISKFTQGARTIRELNTMHESCATWTKYANLVKVAFVCKPHYASLSFNSEAVRWQWCCKKLTALSNHKSKKIKICFPGKVINAITANCDVAIVMPRVLLFFSFFFSCPIIYVTLLCANRARMTGNHLILRACVQRVY